MSTTNPIDINKEVYVYIRNDGFIHICAKRGFDYEAIKLTKEEFNKIVEETKKKGW